MEIYVKDNKALSLDSKFLSPAASGETWILNNSINVPSGFSYDVAFTSNGVAYTNMRLNGMYFYYGDTAVTGRGDMSFDGFDFNGVWNYDVYKTIVFDISPIGDLLTWLQANGTKQ